MDPMAKLQAALAEAQARLAEETDEQARSQLSARAAQLQAEIGRKSAEDGPRGEIAKLTKRITELEEEKQVAHIQKLTGEIAETFEAGRKRDEAAREDRYRQLIAEELGKRMNLPLGADGRYDLVPLIQQAAAGTKGARQTPIETDYDGRPQVSREADEEDTRVVRRGAKGGTGIISGRGEKAGLHTFMAAIARKDAAAIRDLQSAAGLAVGAKALMEGGGATNLTDGPGGGFLVPPQYSTELIDLLRARAILRRAGADVITMTSPQFFQPKLTGAASATYVGEAQTIPLSQETFGQIALTAKKLTSLVPISNELLRDSRPAAESRIKTDMAKVIALKEDISFLYGVGSALVPQGILNRTDIQHIAAVGTNGDQLSYDTLIAAIFKLETANLPAVNRVWMMNPMLLQKLVSEKDLNGRPLFANYLDIQSSSILPTNGGGERTPTLLGMPIYTSTQIPLGTTGTGATSDLALVEMSEVLIGNMEEMYMDSSAEASVFDGTNWISAFQSDLTVFRAIMRHDINLTHPQAVVVYQGLIYS